GAEGGGGGVGGPRGGTREIVDRRVQRAVGDGLRRVTPAREHERIAPGLLPREEPPREGRFADPGRAMDVHRDLPPLLRDLRERARERVELCLAPDEEARGGAPPAIVGRGVSLPRREALEALLRARALLRIDREEIHRERRQIGRRAGRERARVPRREA